MLVQNSKYFKVEVEVFQSWSRSISKSNSKYQISMGMSVWSVACDAAAALFWLKNYLFEWLTGLPYADHLIAYCKELIKGFIYTKKLVGHFQLIFPNETLAELRNLCYEILQITTYINKDILTTSKNRSPY